MATSSRIKAVKSRIKTLLDAHADLTGVQVSRGHPGELMERESIWLSGVTLVEDVKILGPQFKRDQAIDVQIIVRVEQEGDDATTLDDRALDLANAVEEALRADPDLNNEVIHGGVTAGEQDSFIEDGARVSAVRLTCTYLARKGP